MLVHYGLEGFSLTGPSAVTIGIFDGVHLAHQKLLSYLKTSGYTSVVFTFWPHPRIVLQGENQQLKLLSTLKEKIRQIELSGIDHLVVIPFSLAFSEMSAESFMQQILVEKANAAEIVLGYDHHFGKNRAGNAAFLRQNEEKYGFKVTEIEVQVQEGIAINSSNIRKVLASGDAGLTAKLLGRPYNFSGIVTKGNQLGRTIGYPTANMYIEEPLKLLPANGVYAVLVEIEGWQNAGRLKGMLNIGFRPTVNGTGLSIEVHIFDFDADIYDRVLSVSIVQRLRDEQKFAGLGALKQQLAKDKEGSQQALEAF